ncbi:phosphatidylinositol transfer protein [Anaeramoeba flamelloides]|uniref:Phosphatidylinositol transfer protein n=1 Tax=Anaeramoeba flamelloides TaxID=1746091 RepID=A0AAV8AEA6_9EUKA|nr:phosphatidylinositol transfer protein [Anaeramoeba flamelloides]KAJ6233946.1 phosphatidylinositol transfer protein [Anaeramoeba flamelloides]
MLIKEYRITLPVTVEQYYLAQLYMVAKETQEITKQSKVGEGIQVLKNEPFKNEKGEGQYTLKHFHIASRLPKWLRKILPKKSMVIIEESWNAFPYCLTSYSSPFLKKFKFSVETMHLADKGETKNALKCDKKTLKKRGVVKIDVVNDPLPKKSEFDVTTKETECGILPLKGKKWVEKAEPVMTCYKLVKVQFPYWGSQKRVEKLVQKKAIHEVFTDTHRKLLCWADLWYSLTIENIREIENETKRIYEVKMKEEKEKQGEKGQKGEKEESSSSDDDDDDDEDENEKITELKEKEETSSSDSDDSDDSD